MELCCLVAVLPRATDCPLCGVGLMLQHLVLCGHCGMWKGPPLVPCAGDLRGNDVVTPTLALEAPELEFLPPAPIRSRGRLGGMESPAAFSISPRQGLLFFLSCLLGSSSSLFFLQKGRKANLEHT